MTKTLVIGFLILTALNTNSKTLADDNKSPSPTPGQETLEKSTKNTMAKNEIQALLLREEDNRSRLDKALADALIEMQKINSGPKESIAAADKKFSTQKQAISSAQEALMENHQRIEFFNALLSALDKSHDVRTDSVQILLDMSHKELMAGVEAGSSGSKVWLFEVYLSGAIRDLLKADDDFAEFVKNYMNFSSLHDPKSPADYRKTLEGHGTSKKSPKKK